MAFGNQETERWTALENENAALRAEIAAVKERMQRLSDALACAINVIEGDDPAWTEKFIRQSRRLLIPESGRVPYASSQAAEVLEQARLTTARMDDELAKAIHRRRQTLATADKDAIRTEPLEGG